MHKTVKFWVWVALVTVMLLIPRNEIWQFRNNWITIFEIHADLPEDIMCPMAMFQRPYGLPMAALRGYGGGCDQPFKQVSPGGFIIDALFAYVIVNSVFRYKASRSGGQAMTWYWWALSILSIVIIIGTFIVSRYFTI